MPCWPVTPICKSWHVNATPLKGWRFWMGHTQLNPKSVMQINGFAYQNVTLILLLLHALLALSSIVDITQCPGWSVASFTVLGNEIIGENGDKLIPEESSGIDCDSPASWVMALQLSGGINSCQYLHTTCTWLMEVINYPDKWIRQLTPRAHFNLKTSLQWLKC